MLFARRNQCFARIIRANFIFGGQLSVFRYPHHGLPAVSQSAAAGTFLLQLRFRELPCAGRWRGMCLRPEHFLFAAVPQDKELEAALFHRLDRKRCCVCSARFLPGSNRAKYCPNCAAAMKRKSAAARKRKQRQRCHALGKSLVNQGLSERCRWVCDTFPIRARKAALKGV